MTSENRPMFRAFRTYALSSTFAGCALVLACVAPGCGGRDVEEDFPPADTGTAETELDTAVVTDTGEEDSTVDTGEEDTAADTEFADTTMSDTAFLDTAVVDTAVVDSGSDTGLVDTGVSDTGADVDSGPAPVCYAPNWCLVTSPTANSLYDVWAAAANDVWAVGSKGTVLHYDGSTWTNVVTPIPATDAAFSVWGTSSTNVYVAAKATIYRFNGTTWSVVAVAPGSGSVVDLDGTVPSDVWGAGVGGTVMRFDGTTWQIVSGAASDAGSGGDAGFGGTIFTAVKSLSPTNTWLFASNGTIRHWDGTTWASVTSPTTSSMNRPWALTANDIYVPLLAGGVLRWDGSVWSPIALPSTAVGKRLYAVWASSSTNVWAVGESGAILNGGRFGFTVAAAPTTGRSDLNGLFGLSTDDIWAVGYGGVILHYKP